MVSNDLYTYMKMSSVCRICLTRGNTALFSVKNNPLLTIYKKLTNTKFNSEDSRPRALCCYCYQKLLKCHTFSQMALRSEKIFNHIYDSGLEVTHDYIAEVSLNVKHPLSVKAMQLINIESNASNSDLQVTVKDELLPDTDIKQEMTSEPDKLVEVGSSLEDCIRSQLIFKEDNNDQENDVKDFIYDIHVERIRPDDSNMPFSCNNCNKIFCVKSKLISHIHKAHSQIKKKQYSSTKKHTETTSAIETIQNLNNQLTCHECDRNFVSKYVLLRHMRIHTGEKSFTCNECDKTFSRKAALVIHMRIHTGKKPFACNVCEKQFYDKYHLLTHIKTHTDEKPFACILCDKKFKHKPSLVSHKRTHTGEKPFACNICDKRFTFNSSLFLHMRTHTDKKPFACNVCDKQFKHKNSLVSHKRTHTDENQFACSLCDKKFKHKPSLVSHMRTHTGEKPFTYHICGKQFNVKHHFGLHMRIHTGEKPFTCNVCDKQFHRKDYLVLHMRIHTGEKPFVCYVCDKQFNQKCTLVLHMRTHRGEKRTVKKFEPKKIN